MKKIYFVAIGILMIHFCSAQDKTFKTKVSKDQNIITTVTLNRETKQKHGRCFQVDVKSGDTLVCGQYANDKRVGLWRFSDKKDAYFTYDFTQKRLLHTSPLIQAIDTFVVKANDGVYILSRVDTPPLFLGYRDEFKTLLAKAIRIPLSVMQFHVAGNAIISFVIDEEGQMKNVQTEVSLDTEMDRAIVRGLNDVVGEWLPAVKDGKPVAAKLLVAVSLYEGMNTSALRSFTPKPYLISLPLCYSSSTRTERRRVLSTSPLYQSNF